MLRLTAENVLLVGHHVDTFEVVAPDTNVEAEDGVILHEDEELLLVLLAGVSVRQDLPHRQGSSCLYKRPSEIAAFD